jgi:ribosomal protein S17
MQPVCALGAGVVKSAKMTRTIIVRRNYAHFIKKYAR